MLKIQKYKPTINSFCLVGAQRGTRFNYNGRTENNSLIVDTATVILQYDTSITTGKINTSRSSYLHILYKRTGNLSMNIRGQIFGLRNSRRYIN